MTIKKQPTVAELAARHTQREVPANIPAPKTVGPPVPGVPGPNGIRVAPADSTDWRSHMRQGDKNWSRFL